MRADRHRSNRFGYGDSILWFFLCVPLFMEVLPQTFSVSVRYFTRFLREMNRVCVRFQFPSLPHGQPCPIFTAHGTHRFMLEEEWGEMKVNEPEGQKLKRQNSWQEAKHANILYALQRKPLIPLESQQTGP